MCRRLALLTILVPLALAGSALGRPTQPDSLTATTFVFTGHGWGHAVGMGQWGAYGMAKADQTFDKILAFYYPGTELGSSPMKTVRVLLQETSKPVTISSASAFRVKDGAGAVHPVAAGAITVDPTLATRLSQSGSAQPLTGPVTVLPGKSPLVAGHPYRGRVQVQLVGKLLQVVNIVKIDDYARGVVTREMPKDWPIQAIEAQAVAARSYAVAVQQAGKTLYVDVRSQAYGGVEGESPAGVEAVEATKNQVLLYNGAVATTYFSSSTGGRTAAITDLVPGVKPVPYLVVQKDPYDASSPWHNWGPVVLSDTRVSSALGVSGVTDLSTVPTTGHARQVVVTTAAGKKILPASVLRGALGLRSTFVRIGRLSLSRPAGSVVPGTPLDLTGVVRGVKGQLRVQSSVDGSAWTPGTAVVPASDGTFSFEVTPSQTTSYRLSAQGVSSEALVVPVTSAKRTWRQPAVARSSARSSSPLASVFDPGDPLTAGQWYLGFDRAFDFWPDLPALEPVLVGVVDTGIDADHPEFAGKIAAARSFVGGTIDDEIGHGTFVAGEIAATLGNGEGIAGIAFPARLLVAKVVGLDGTIDPAVEARAIRWQVDHGARVINLSLGAVRDPSDRSVDSFSEVEAEAVQYAVSHGVLVVAAVGNGDDAPSSPWPYASYPAALPHVLAVGAVARDGSVPTFSNRDGVYDDLVAPGVGILSTFPRALTGLRPACTDQGYSDCGTTDYVDGDGTSFSAPQVTAAAALLFATNPTLTADQVQYVLERSATDASASTGCSNCIAGRDALSGWGMLDITAALQALEDPLPAPDSLEPNDDAGSLARKVWGSAPVVRATADYWDDPIDVYRVRVGGGQRVTASLTTTGSARQQLVLWKPGTEHVKGPARLLHSQRLLESSRPGRHQSFSYRAGVAGWYDVEVKLTAPGSGPYTLRFRKS